MNASATRREFVHIFFPAMDSYKAINSVADNAIPDVKLGDKCADEIYAFYRAGILTGSDKQGSFRPDSTIVRSEVAAILIRMYDASARAVHTEIIFNQANERVRTLSEPVQSFLGNSWYSTAYDQTFIDDPTVSIDLGTCPS